MGFSLFGTILALLMLLPSIIFFIRFPNNAVQEADALPKIFVMLEKIGQPACIISLILSKDFFVVENMNGFTVLMAVCMILYYALWVIAFRKGGDFSIMLKPLWFIPIPGAVLPVSAFAFAALWGKSVWLGAATVIVAIGHCAVSFSSYKQIKSSGPKN